MTEYIFGGSTGLSLSDLQKRRALAQAMMQNATRRAPQNVGEGLSALGQAIGARMRMGSADRQIAAGRKSATDQFNDLLSGFGSSSSAQPSSNIGSVAGADNIRSGLIERGLPEHVADGFVMNFKDESGLDPGINEREPIVPGSRGGYGLAQWTGPRRRALEAYAAERGVPVSDADMQLDFLMHELGGSESAAAKSIMSAGSSGEAAAAIVNDFLRPAETHRASRERRYLGGASPAQRAQGLDPRLVSALDNPYMTDGQKAVLQAMLAPQLKAMLPPDRREQLELQKLEQEVAQAGQPKSTDDIREFIFARQNGYQGSFTDFMTDMKQAGASSTSVNVNNAAGPVPVPEYPKLDKGFMYLRDPETSQIALNEQGLPTVVPIPGGPADIEAQERLDAQEKRQEGEERRAGIVSQEIDRALEIMNTGILPDVGFGAAISGIPGTDAKAISGLFETIKANIGFEELNRLRQQSKTGGALGQVTERELAFLQAVAGSLDQSQSKQQLTDNLNRLWNEYQKVIHGEGNFERRPLSFEAQDETPTPQTQEEFDALAPGAEYIDPDDGKRYRKPGIADETTQSVPEMTSEDIQRSVEYSREQEALLQRIPTMSNAELAQMQERFQRGELSLPVQRALLEHLRGIRANWDQLNEQIRSGVAQ